MTDDLSRPLIRRSRTRPQPRRAGDVEVVEAGFLTIGYGDPGCVDRLNTIYYKLPILNEDPPLGGPDKQVVLVDSSVLIAEQCGLYREGDRVLEDQVSDLEDFFTPILRAVVPVLAEYIGGAVT